MFKNKISYKRLRESSPSPPAPPPSPVSQRKNHEKGQNESNCSENKQPEKNKTVLKKDKNLIDL